MFPTVAVRHHRSRRAQRARTPRSSDRTGPALPTRTPTTRPTQRAVASDGGRGRVPSSRLMSCVGGWSEDPRRRQRAQTSEWCGGRAPDARQGRDPNIAGNITTPTIRYRRQSGRTECGGNCSVRGLPQPARVVDDGVVRGAGGSVAGGGEQTPASFRGWRRSGGHRDRHRVGNWDGTPSAALRIRPAASRGA